MMKVRKHRKLSRLSNTIQQADKVLNIGDDEHEYQV